MRAYFDTYEELFALNLPKLFEYFKTTDVTPELYLIEW